MERNWGRVAVITWGAVGATLGACGCKQSASHSAASYAVTRAGEASANIYQLALNPLQPNSGSMEASQGNRLVRIRGEDPNGDVRAFDVFFGPGASERPTNQPGRGRYTNDDPTWQNVQGYAVMRGIRPSGSTQYVKATSNSSTLITLVDRQKGEERVLLTEGKEAYVHLLGQPLPIAPNLAKGQVIIVRMVSGTMTIQPAIDYTTDPESVDLLNYLKTMRGAKDVGFE